MMRDAAADVRALIPHLPKCAVCRKPATRTYDHCAGFRLPSCDDPACSEDEFCAACGCYWDAGDDGACGEDGCPSTTSTRKRPTLEFREMPYAAIVRAYAEAP